MWSESTTTCDMEVLVLVIDDTFDHVASVMGGDNVVVDAELSTNFVQVNAENLLSAVSWRGTPLTENQWPVLCR